MSFDDHLGGLARERLESLKRRGLLEEPISAAPSGPYPGRRSDYHGYPDPHTTSYAERRPLLGRRPADGDYGRYPSSYDSQRHVGGYEPPVKRPLLEPSYSSYDRGRIRGHYGQDRDRGETGHGRGDFGRGRSEFGQERGIGDRGRGRGDGNRGRGDGNRGRVDGYRGRGDGNRGRGNSTRGREDTFRGRGRDREDSNRGREGFVKGGRGGGFQNSGEFNRRGRGGSRESFVSSSTAKVEAKPESKPENDQAKSDIKSSDSKTPKTIKTDVKAPTTAEKEKKDSTPKPEVEPKVKASEPKEMKKASKSESKPPVKAPSIGLGRGLAACLMNMSDNSFPAPGSSTQAEPSLKQGSRSGDPQKPETEADSNCRNKGQGNHKNDTLPPDKPNSQEKKVTVERNQPGGHRSNGKDSIPSTDESTKTNISDNKGTFCQPCNSSFLNAAQYNAHVRGVIHEQNLKKSSDVLSSSKQTSKTVPAKGTAVSSSSPVPKSVHPTPSESISPAAAVPSTPTSASNQPYKSIVAEPPASVAATPPISTAAKPSTSAAAKMTKPTAAKQSTSAAVNDSDSDSDDDGTHCKVCKMTFDDRGKYIRHTKGLMHTQKKIEYEKSKGSTKYDDIPDSDTNQVFAFGNRASVGRGRGSSIGSTASPHGENKPWSQPQSTATYEERPYRSQRYAAYTVYDAKEDEYYDESLDETYINRKEDVNMEERRLQHMKDAGITDEMLAEANMMIPKTDPSERELRPEDVGRVQFPSEYHCKLCDAKCTSAVTFQSHLAGTKHKNNVAAAAKGTLKIKKKKHRPSVISLDRTSRIEELFAEVTNSAVIGLNYITEFQKLDPKATTMCVCNLCESKCDENTVVSHVIGLKHKIRYMREKHPVMYEHFKKFAGRKSKQTAFAEELAQDVEKEDGRGMVNLKVNLEDQEEEDDTHFDASSLLDTETESHHAKGTGLLPLPHTGARFQARPEAPKRKVPARSEADEEISEDMRHRLHHQINITARRYSGSMMGKEEEASPGGKLSRVQAMMKEMSGSVDPYTEEQPKGYQWNKNSVNQGYHGKGYQREEYEGQDYQTEEYQAEQYEESEYQGEGYPEYPSQQYPEEEYQEQEYNGRRFQDKNYEVQVGKKPRHRPEERSTDSSVEHDPYSQEYGHRQPHDSRGRGRGRGVGRGRGRPGSYEDDPYERPKPSYGDDPYQRSRPGNDDKSYERPKPSYGDDTHQRSRPGNDDESYERPKPNYGDDPYQRSRPGNDDKSYERPKPSYGDDPYQRSRPGNGDESYERSRTGYGDLSHQRPTRPAPRPSDPDDADMNKRRLDDLVRRGLITETERKNMELAQNVAEKQPEPEKKPEPRKPQPSFDDLSFLKDDPDFKEFLKARVQALQQQQQQQQPPPQQEQHQQHQQHHQQHQHEQQHQYQQHRQHQQQQHQHEQQHQYQQHHQQQQQAPPTQHEQTWPAEPTLRKSRKAEEAVKSKREKVSRPPVEEKDTAGLKGDDALPGQIGDMLQTLSSSMISSEDEAAVALQVSNALTQALLSYRLRSHPGEAQQQDLSGHQLPPPPSLPNMPHTGFPLPGYPGNPSAVSGTSNIPTAVPPPVTSLSSRGGTAETTTHYPTPNPSIYPAISKNTSFIPYPPPLSAGKVQYPPTSESVYPYHAQTSHSSGQYQYTPPGGSYSPFQPPLPDYEPPKPPPPPPSF